MDDSIFEFSEDELKKLKRVLKSTNPYYSGLGKKVDEYVSYKSKWLLILKYVRPDGLKNLIEDTDFSAQSIGANVAAATKELKKLGLKKPPSVPLLKRRYGNIDVSSIGNTDLYKVKEVAELLGITPRTVRRFCAEGKINHIRLGPHTVRISGKAIKDMLSPVM